MLSTERQPVRMALRSGDPSLGHLSCVNDPVFCNVDSPRQELSGILTSDRAYLRLHGRKHWYSHNYSTGELEAVAHLTRNLADRGATRIYVFFNNDFEGYAPANALTLLKMLEAP